MVSATTSQQVKANKAQQNLLNNVRHENEYFTKRFVQEDIYNNHDQDYVEHPYLKGCLEDMEADVENNEYDITPVRDFEAT